MADTAMTRSQLSLPTTIDEEPFGCADRRRGPVRLKYITTAVTPLAAVTLGGVVVAAGH